MYWKTLLLIFTILPSSLYCAWPFSSEGIVEICAVELCDCTEPNIRCANHNFTEVNLVLPDDTDVVDFSRNMVKKIDGLQKWPKSIIEINLSRNQIFQINQNVFDTFTLLENLDLSYNKINLTGVDQYFKVIMFFYKCLIFKVFPNVNVVYSRVIHHKYTLKINEF